MRAYRQLFLWLSHFRWFSFLSYSLLVPIDHWLYRRSEARLSLLHVGRRRPPVLPTLLLTTTGRKTGQPRTTPVLYLEHEGRLIVVGSNFGRERHPSWSSNLLADPQATVRVREGEHRVIARRASADEVRRLWPRLRGLYPPWETYTGRTDRTFRVFFLGSRRSDASP
jgi:deazaflavin-dependent oxidoreductase (nitroreductase family)